MANPNNIARIYRHLLPIDFTILQLIEKNNKLETEISKIHKKLNILDKKLSK